MKVWQRRVGTLYLAAAVACACCLAIAAYALPSRGAPPCAGQRCSEGDSDANRRPVVEAHGELPGRAHDVTFNPSVVVGVAPHPQCSRGPVVVLYRDADLTASGGRSYVSARLWSLPPEGFAGRLGECSPSPAVQLDAEDPLLQLALAEAGLGAAANASGSGSACRLDSTGYEDPRGLVTADGSLLVFVNNVRPADCRRRMAVLRTTLGEIAAAAAAAAAAPGGPRRGSVAVRSVTWLTYNERVRVEKNWVPFAEGPEPGSVLVTYSLNPHVVLSCPTRGDNATCRQLAWTSWPRLVRHVGSGASPVRPSNVPVHRSETGDYIAVGHFRLRKAVSFFFYTFEGRAPYALTGASGSFRFDVGDAFQYLSGFARVGEYYVATFSVRDNSTHTASWHHCQVDRMVTRFQASPDPIGIIMTKRSKIN
eukprot:m51a1_g14197 hypothetical protein (423) ;mRNA; f:116404-117672